MHDPLELHIAPDTVVIGLIARFDAQKDHANFLKAVKLFVDVYQNVAFIMCGDKINEANAFLTQMLYEFGIAKYCILLDRRDDVPQLMNACDIITSSSYSEAFPLVIGEAMSCAVPCVVTDVGDSSWIVGSTGLVVPPRDPKALANAWIELINIGKKRRSALGTEARKRICHHFSLAAIVQRYQNLYEELIVRSTH